MTYEIKLDASGRDVLAWCTGCPPWRELRPDRPAALEAAAVHAQLVHADALRGRRLRAAARRTRDTPGDG